MDKHPTFVFGYTHRELARAIANLRYDHLAKFLGCLADELLKDAEKDARLNHPQLSAWLKSAANKVITAKIDVRTIWSICRPHMNISKD